MIISLAFLETSVIGGEMGEKKSGGKGKYIVVSIKTKIAYPLKMSR